MELKIVLYQFVSAFGIDNSLHERLVYGIFRSFGNGTFSLDPKIQMNISVLIQTKQGTIKSTGRRTDGRMEG